MTGRRQYEFSREVTVSCQKGFAAVSNAGRDA